MILPLELFLHREEALVYAARVAVQVHFNRSQAQRENLDENTRALGVDPVASCIHFSDGEVELEDRGNGTHPAVGQAIVIHAEGFQRLVVAQRLGDDPNPVGCEEVGRDVDELDGAVLVEVLCEHAHTVVCDAAARHLDRPQVSNRDDRGEDREAVRCDVVRGENHAPQRKRIQVRARERALALGLQQLGDVVDTLVCDAIVASHGPTQLKKCNEKQRRWIIESFCFDFGPASRPAPATNPEGQGARRSRTSMSNHKMGATGELHATGELRATENLGATGELRATGNLGATGELRATGNLGATGELRATGELDNWGGACIWRPTRGVNVPS